MADLENIESLTVQATLQDGVTAPSNNMTGALDKVAGGVERVTEKLSRARPGLESTGRLVDTQTALLLKQQQVMERYGARVQALNELYQKQGRSAQELSEGIRRLGVIRDDDMRRSQEYISKREQLFSGDSGATARLEGDIRKVGASAAYQRQQMVNFFQQVQDFGVQIASGGGLFYPLVQQVPQAVSALGGVSDAWTKAVGFIRSGTGALALAGAAVAALVLVYNNHEAKMADLRSTLRGVAGDYDALAKATEAASKRIEQAGIGVSRDDASKVMNSLRQAAPVGTNVDFEGLTKSAADFARVMGTSVTDAGTRFAQGMREPAAFVREMADKGFPGMTEALRRTVEGMAASGDRVGAFTTALEAMQNRLNGAAKDVSPLQESFRGLKTSWSEFTEVVGPWVATGGKVLLDFLTGLANVAGLVASGFTAIGSGLKGGLGRAFTSSGSSTFGDQELDRFEQQLIQRENAGRVVNARNQFGYTGLYQMGTAALNAAGVYAPASGENLRRNEWRGTMMIPGMPEITTPDQFRESEAAQRVAFKKHIDHLNDLLDALPGVDKFSRSGLLAVAHGYGPGAAEEFVRNGGRSDRLDGNQVRLDETYRRFADQAVAAVRAADATRGAGGRPNTETPPDTRSDAARRADELIRGRDYRQDTLRLRAASAATIEAALNEPGFDQNSEQAARYREELEKIRAEIVGLETPMEALRRQGGLQAQLYENQAGAARELAAAEQAAREAARTAGKSDAEIAIQGLEARRQKEAELNDQLRQRVRQLNDTAEAQGNVNEIQAKYLSDFRDMQRQFTTNTGRNPTSEDEERIRAALLSNIDPRLRSMVDQNYQGARAAARGVVDNRLGYAPIARSDEGRMVETAQSIRILEAGMADPASSAQDIDAYRAKLEELRRTQFSLQDPNEKLIRDVREAADAALNASEAQGAFNQKLIEFRRQGEASGKPVGEDQVNRYAAELIRAQSAPIMRAGQDAERQTEAQRRLAAAYSEGSEAVGRATNFERALDLVRKQSIGTDRQKEAAARALAQQYDEVQRAQNNTASAQAVQQQRAQIELLREEQSLLGLGVTAREQELAAITAISQARNRPGGTDEAYVQREGAAAREAASVRQELERQRAAYAEVENFGTQAFDRIGEAITQSFILGEGQAVKFKDVVRGVISEMTQWLLKLAVMNPLKNWLTGSNLPNLFDVGTAVFGGGAGGGDGIGGGGLGSLLGSVGSFFGLGGGGGAGIAQASGQVNTWTALMGAATNSALGSMGGQFGPATAAQVQAAGGPGMMGYAQQAMQAYSLYNNFGRAGSMMDRLSGLNPGNYMTGAYDWTGNSIVGAFDKFAGSNIGNWLNTPIYGVTHTAQTAATNTALAANASSYSTTGAGVGFGPATAGEVANAGGSAAGAGGMTYGSAAAGVLGVAAGAYGTYQGIKRGGVGGYTSAAGSAAMGAMSGYAAIAGSMAAVPVYGWIAAAALMVVGALLPGQKPSDKTGTFTANTLEGLEGGEEGGLTGKKFSQENRDQARAVAGTLQQIANRIGSAAGLPGAANATFRVEVGARDGLKVALDDRMLQGNLDEEGIKSVTDAWTSVMLQKAAEQTSDPLMARVINASGTGDPEKTLGNMQWYQDTYRQLANPNEFERNRMEITRKWQEGIDKAVELSLPTEALVSRRDVELRQLEERRGADEASARADLRDRSFADRGGVRGADQIASEAARAQSNRIRGRIDLENQLSSLGLTGGAADEFRQLLAEAEAAEERLRVRTLGRTQEDLAYNQTTSGMSAELRLRQAQGAAGDQAALRQVEDTNFAVQASRSLVELRRSLEDLGFSAEAIAGQMGLATQAIDVERANLSRQQARRVEDISVQSAAAGTAQWQRYYSAMGARTGNPGYGNEAERLGFESNAQQGLVQLRRSLEDLGWSSQAIAEQIGLASQAISVERENLQRIQGRRNEDYGMQLQAAGTSPWIQRYTALGQQQQSNVGYANEAERLQFELNAGQSIVQLRRSLEDLGLSSTEVAARIAMATETIGIERGNLALAQQRRVEDYYQNVANLRSGLDVRSLRASGRTDEAAMLEFDRNAEQERLNLGRQLFDLGFSAQETAARLAQFGDIIAEERESVIEQIRDQRAGTALGPIESLANYAQSLRYGEESPLSVQDQLAAAQKSFMETSAKATGGDFASIQGLQSASDTYLQLAREVYGSGSDYITAFTKVTDALDAVGNMTVDTLTAAVYVAEQRSLAEQLVAALERVREEVALSRAETLQVGRLPLRVNG